MKINLAEIPVLKRHSTFFRAYDDLPGGGEIEIEVDHDPRRLYSQLFLEKAGQFSWSYLEEGPETWRVRVVKTPFDSGSGLASRDGCCGCCGVE